MNIQALKYKKLKYLQYWQYWQGSTAKLRIPQY